MISYNNVIYISKLFKEKHYDKLLVFINEKIPNNNIIDFLIKCAEERFVRENDCIKLQLEKKELIVYKENFLKEIPSDKTTIHKIDNFHVTIGYPSSLLFLPATCIKKIQHKDTVLDINKSDYTDIPLSLIKKCTPYIDTYIEDLNKSFIYYINKNHNSRFTYSKEVIIHIVYLCFVQNYENLLEQQLLLMKHYNFSYRDFDYTSYNQINDYMKIVQKAMKSNE